ncbi:MAG TPA: regulator SirB [Sedimenticola sp.]|nr:regulator SirB [Sedimenticola sp.]
MTYFWIKQLHVGTVVFTITFFVIRLGWMRYRPALLARPWVQPLSVANDILLLAAGITLAVMSHQYPLVAPWLTAKLVALVVYIVLGSYALKRGKNRGTRTLYGLLALLTVGYIVSVALTRTPTPWVSPGW